MSTSDHQMHMRECLRLAALASGRTSPNPLVGSVVLDKNGVIVGRGYHKKHGQAHAEVGALDEAGERAKGGTIYVNLEPCCHFGKTPPCSKRVIESGVKTVITGMQDPNPVVDGGGIAEIRNAGIEVITNVLNEECILLNKGFIKKVRTGLPWICLKLATTLDGKIADRHGQSRWITGTEARQYVHNLRNLYDAVLVGTTTALADNPSLNVRDVSDSRDPVKVLLDRDLKVSFQSKLYSTESSAKVFVLTSEENAQSRKLHDLPQVELLGVPFEDEKEQVLNLEEGLKLLPQKGVNTVLCEGGGKLAGHLIEKGLVDEILWMIAPKILNDTLGKLAIDSPLSKQLDQAAGLKRVNASLLGSDVAYCALFEKSEKLLFG